MIWSLFAVVLFVRFVGMPDLWRRTDHDREMRSQSRRYYGESASAPKPQSELPGDLWRVHIEISGRDANILRGYQWNGWRGGDMERPEVKVTVREGGAVYTNVALHLKGSAGSFRPFDHKPALTLNFSKHAKGQSFHGYSKISLNNSVQDPSYLCEILARELFNAAGVPTPLAGHATVLINNRDLGLYVFTEGWGKPYLKRHFENVKGNLYDGGFCREISDGLDVNSGDKPDDRSDLARLMAAAEADPEVRWNKLGQVLDLDRFISMLAMEVLTCHWDGYALNKNNYRVFHDLKSDRMIFMPHGMDQMFGSAMGGGARFPTYGSIEPQMRGLVAQAVQSTTPGYTQFMARLAELRTNVFIPERLTNRVHELSRTIRPTLAAYGDDLARDHDFQVEDLCRRIVERARSVSEQLLVPREPVTFDEEGVLPLPRWSSYQSPESSRRMRHTEFQDENNKDLKGFVISANRGGGTASWRKRVRLPAGRYRFEGRCVGRNLNRGDTVCLRISGRQTGGVSLDENGWTPLEFEFEVNQPMAEVTLVCEMRARSGEAFFDANSLRLVRAK